MSTVIASVDHRSPAQRAGIRPGEKLLTINGHEIVDVLDYRFYGYDAKCRLELLEPNGSVRNVQIKKEEGLDLGLNFDTYLMDEMRCCANHCVFCFVDQMPPGMRQTLYFKDDDARLSFLQGNYITLTNLTEREAQRIIDLRISPINVSVHTTDPQLHCTMLGNKNAVRSLEYMRRFCEAGIVMNGQIVICPGWNDGDQLRRTLRDLTEMEFSSCSLVPVGITKYRKGLAKLRPVDAATAAEIIDIADEFGRENLERFGTRRFFCADELFLRAGRPLPEEDYYEEFTQLDNGVGMLRLLRQEFRRGLDLMEAEEMERTVPFSIATGVSAAPFLTELVELARKKCGKIEGTVYPIRNDFFGETIVVAGLVTGGDLIAQLRGKKLGERLLIPANMLRHGERVFLDDVSLDDVERALGVPVIPVEQDGYELLDAMCGISSGLPRQELPREETEYYQYNP